MIRGITTELCAGSIRDCLLAERFPIDRIELSASCDAVTGRVPCTVYYFP